MNSIHLAKYHGVLLETLLKIFKAHFLFSNHDFRVKWHCRGKKELTINSTRKFLYMDLCSVAREHGLIAYENLNLENQAS